MISGDMSPFDAGDCSRAPRNFYCVFVTVQDEIPSFVKLGSRQ